MPSNSFYQTRGLRKILIMGMPNFRNMHGFSYYLLHICNVSLLEPHFFRETLQIYNQTNKLGERYNIFARKNEITYSNWKFAMNIRIERCAPLRCTLPTRSCVFWVVVGRWGKHMCGVVVVGPPSVTVVVPGPLSSPSSLTLTSITLIKVLFST